MPDLGRYALEVGVAYAGTAILLLGLVATTLIRGRAVRRALDEAEGRRTPRADG